ncbi:N-acyl-D-amino-acid deacylase family protein [Paenibacillus alkalitolerans]|uniref:N-acyl-D-amino-acid deacylase family protein n=1 Tax=Paenibacillus alkalitolerans TaxID=2799335 RepID=UPI0018F6B20C|nr:D-aminoacylase [Paenibacillus alkalitolerans]
MLDTIIKNGRIADGTGNPWYYGDIGIQGGKIAMVGTVEQEAAHVIDARRLVVAPGFIDGHCHSDLMILNYPQCDIKLSQGVTTEVVGNCGLAPAPCLEPYGKQLQEYVQPILGGTREWSWRTIGQYIDALAKRRPSENVSTYVAHGALRIAVMGFADRPASGRELDRMKALLEEGLQAGAIGLSIGLLYAPGSYAAKEEIAALCSVLPKYGGLFSTHVRGEGNRLVESVKEVIWIARHAGVPLHISHLKAAGRRNWGKAEAAMELISDARSQGMDVTCDVYPYNASSTMLTTLLPPWALEGGLKKMLLRLRDPSIREKVKAELAEEREDWDNLVCSTGWDKVFIASVRTESNRPVEGKHIAEISEMRGVHPAECAMDLLLEEDAQISIVYFLMSEGDVKQVVTWSHSLIASDSLHCDTGKPHPRLYGSFPRVFAKYVREERALTLEQAVRKMTSFPAQRFKLGRRGLVVPGYAADLVVFDPEAIQDHATYRDPKQAPSGIGHVLVNGTLTMREGVHTNAKGGVFVPARRCCTH